jgi:hypothetical protein
VASRVERLAERGVTGDTGALQHLQHLALDQLDTAHDALGSAGGSRRAERAVQIVQYGDEIAQQRLVRVPDRLVPFALRPPLEVLGLRERPQQPVLLLLELLPQLLDRLAPRRIGDVRTMSFRLVHNS